MLNKNSSGLLHFTIRVYGILVDAVKGILVADEFQNGQRFTKFPGGGLELGEGTTECLVREWEEELKQQIEVTDHFYTTDFFQQSAFDPAKQVISIYYRVKALEEPLTKISTVPFDYGEEKDGAASFRWIEGVNFQESMLTFPIDIRVAKMVRESLLI
ncbi:MAG: NUDIX domain-containing protein [Chitinophagales bacterium]